MIVETADWPSASMLIDELEKAYYHDSFVGVLSDSDLDIVAIYKGIFAHAPWWVYWLMKLRDKIVALFGFEKSQGFSEYSFNGKGENSAVVIGQKLGIFTIYNLTVNEMVLGVEDCNGKVKISVMKTHEKNIPKVCVSTLVHVYKKRMRIYMNVIQPLHKLIAKKMLSNAVRMQRI